MNILHLFGWRGVKRAYLNLSYDAAKARYEAENGGVEDEPHRTIVFADTFPLYDADEDLAITETDRVQALIATEIRADITKMAVTFGIYAPATDLGRTIGVLFQEDLPVRTRKRDPDPAWTLYIVTPHLAQQLKERSAAVAHYEGIDLWMRRGEGPIESDPRLLAIAAA